MMPSAKFHCSARIILLLQLWTSVLCAEPPEGESFFFTPPGFARVGKPVTASGAGTGKLHIVVRDAATKQPTPCRIAVVGPDGNFYQPPENALTKYSLTGEWPAKGVWGNRRDKAPYRYLGRYFYSKGETTIDVSAGSVRVEVGKGFEFRPVTAAAKIESGKTSDLELTIDRVAAMADHGYFGGDLHLHFPRVTEQDDETILDLLEAEDVWYGTPLGYNEPAGPYTGVMEKMDSPQLRRLGIASVRRRGNYQMLSGQEYRSANFGHLNLFLRDRPVFEGESFNADDGPAFGFVGAETQAQGGIAIHAHGGYALEIYADAALGTVDAVELLQFGVYRGIERTDWYHMLNAGYRFPCVGASDFPACRFMSDCRTYAWDEINSPPIDSWLKQVADGKSFVTTGPLVLLEVDGHRPGDLIRFDSVQPRTAQVRIRVRSEVTPVTKLDVIVNGVVVKHVDLPPEKSRDDWFEWTQPLEVRTSSWIAARAYSTTPGGQPDAESHTNPVYIHFNGRTPYQRESLDAWLAKVDQQIAKHMARTFKGKAAVLAYFQRARDVLFKIRERGGLASDERPAELAGWSPSRLDQDGSVADVTDAELKAFLKPVPPLPPHEALKSFEVAKGFRWDLVATEPLVRDPVAAAFDADGNLFVCEMRDYPYKPVAGQEPLGGVRMLRDTDSDGYFDVAHPFADKLLWAAGVAPWDGGVFVAAPPDIWFMKDTDGDFMADVRERVFTGFGLENQQAMVNNLQMGLDHWIYGSTAGNGGSIRPGNDPQAKPVDVRGRDFRFDPRTRRFEAITGTVQFGNTFDDWGQRFVCSESQPLQHIVLEDRYLARNPFLIAPHPIHNVAPGPVPIFRISPVERWRQVRSSRRIAKNERAATSAGASHHVIDAAAGVTIYRGGAYAPEFYGNVFVGDGQNNLVHRRILEPDDVTFKSRRADEGTEMIRSSDIWFRPVNFCNAPDGSLYCLDMCREVLESIHIPLDVVKHLDLTSGRDHGRIYRLAPADFRPPPPPRLSRSVTAELVATLSSPHGWQRDTAHRLIYERQDKSVVPALRDLVRHGKLPQARVLALWSLDGLGELDQESLADGLRDVHPGIRHNALRLAESRMNTDSRFVPLVAALASDPEPSVRLQAAFSIGASNELNAAATLAKLATSDGGNPWFRAAILSSAPKSAAALFVELRTNAIAKDAAMLEQLAFLVGSRNQADEMRAVLNDVARTAAEDPLQAERLVRHVGRGLRRSGAKLSITEFDSAARTMLTAMLETRRETVIRAEATPTEQAAAVELLSHFESPDRIERLVGLVDSDRPDVVQVAAIQALSSESNPVLAQALLGRWKSLSPNVRRAAIDAMLSRDDRTRQLLAAAANGELSLSDVELTRRELLRNHTQPAIRELAENVFGPTSPARAAIVLDYQAALGKATGNTERGTVVFEKNCAGCHQLAGKGFAIGPNLASSPSRDTAALLAHILDPNQYVLPNFVQYVAVDNQGRTFAGVLISQSAASITLKKQRDETITLLRADLDELTSTGRSLMPDGFEKAIDASSMADLIAYLQSAAVQSAADPNRERDFGTLPGIVEPK